MVLQNKYKRANSNRYRATHSGIQSNRQKADQDSNQSSKSHEKNSQEEFPSLNEKRRVSTSNANRVEEEDGYDDCQESLLFRRRQLVSNISRYDEPEPDPEEEPEPEVDLRAFLEKQNLQLSDAHENNKKSTLNSVDDEDEDDIDESFNDLYKHSNNSKPSHSNNKLSNKKIVVDPSSLGLEQLKIEREKTDATRELLARFTGRNNVPITTKKNKSSINDSQPSSSTRSADLILPVDDQDFLDEVLNDSSGTYGKHKNISRKKKAGFEQETKGPGTIKSTTKI